MGRKRLMGVGSMTELARRWEAWPGGGEVINI